MQFKTPDTTALAHLMEQETMQLPAHEEDENGIELKAHDAFGGAPVIFQDEPEPAAEQDTPLLENQQDTTTQPEEVIPTEQLFTSFASTLQFLESASKTPLTPAPKIRQNFIALVLAST